MKRHLIVFAAALRLALFAADAAATVDGTFDSTWAHGGYWSFNADIYHSTRPTPGEQIVLESNGNLLLGGTVINSGAGEYWWLGELLPDGSPVLTFGASDGSGLVTSCSFGLCDGSGFSAFAQKSDGRIDVTDGVKLYQTTAQAHAIDKTTGNAPAIVSLNNTINNVRGSAANGPALALLPSGQWIYAGLGYYSLSDQTNGSSHLAAARLNADLSLDTTFNNATDTNNVTFSGGQIVTIDGSNYSEQAFAAVVQGDGRIVLAGIGSTGIPSNPLEFARLNRDGSLDTTFGGAGTGMIIVGAVDANYRTQHSLKTDRAGRLLYVSLEGQIFRSSADGVADSTFGSAGIAAIPSPSFCVGSTGWNSLAVDTAGRLLAVGYCQVAGGSTAFIVARVHGDDGSLDTMFGIGGYSSGRFDAASTYDGAQDVVFDSSGRPLLVGGSKQPSSSAKVGVGRLTYDLIYTNNFETAPPGRLPGQ